MTLPGELLNYGWIGLTALTWMGLSLGSFLNVVIYRLPVMNRREWRVGAREILEMPEEDFARPFNLARPNSRCPNCDHKITALENIPILSWLFLRGKCRNCAQRISIRYPLVELLTAILVLTCVASYGYTWLGLAAVLYTCILVALAYIDYDTQYLPDQLTLGLLWLGLLVNLTVGFTPLHDAVIGALAGYLCLWTLYWAFKIITGKEGMGYGDFKLLAAIGAWLGWQVLPGVLLLAAATGLVYALFGIFLKDRERTQPIAFGPFLAVAGWVSMIRPELVTGLFLTH
ncbi:MAG: A24 family peptidase [Pseudomonadales bacterium]|nr:A24 family peptidase [Pseudomonadales bacterium]MDP6470892.1 A24 family peptidase [Pseudomonadales bacterium]MDP6825923.1 A24 family peptidase [Pseudomonadales bacterium]MDP6972235.1 A24 family peptidase [Pseudomonadales bacterium]